MATDLFKSIGGLERLLDYHLERHGLLASNVSNAETPNYRPRDLVFNESLTKAREMSATAPGHFGQGKESGTNHFVEVEYGPTSVDKNGVRLERAMARLTANKVRYNSSVEVLKRRMAIIKYAASSNR